MILPPSFPGGHIRAVREGDWTYAVYFGLDGSGLDYELYNIKSDPGELDNLLYQRPAPADVKKEWRRLHRLLTASLVEVANLPDTIANTMAANAFMEFLRQASLVLGTTRAPQQGQLQPSAPVTITLPRVAMRIV